ncbi:MAG TPA: T9SS type A sorting domain-containing protein, partial [Bacteroidales bacterium]|nr:T9SS type A sorting domain-containing protein [Bacteroidales bacterium]
ETAMQFAFYPNPADESITIRTSQTDYKVSIYTLTGQQIIRKTNSSTIDISDIAAGTYIVLFKSGDTLSRRKLVVE